jgi:hypothetical protein
VQRVHFAISDCKDGSNPAEADSGVIAAESNEEYKDVLHARTNEVIIPVVLGDRFSVEWAGLEMGLGKGAKVWLETLYKLCQ